MKIFVQALKSKWVYYLMTLPACLPLPFFFLKYISFNWFVVLILFAALAYFPYLNYLRLRALGVNEKHSLFYNIFVLGWRHYWKIH